MASDKDCLEMLGSNFHRLKFTRKVMPRLNISYGSQSIYQGTNSQVTPDNSSTQIRKILSSH